jgi:superfamily II DNA/RNA helicase
MTASWWTVSNENDENDLLESDGASFAALGLHPQLTEALTALGYEEPTPIQAEAIPHMLAGHDLLGQAATGTGKTAAFALPILQRLAERAGPRQGPLAVILVPTRELAIQVSEAIYRYGRGLGAKVVALYGGQPIFRQLQALSQGVDVVVATPGRWRSCWCPPVSSPSRSPRPSTATAGVSAPASCRSTAASRSSASCAPSTAASTS